MAVTNFIVDDIESILKNRITGSDDVRRQIANSHDINITRDDAFLVR